jgi:hypothetical protein
MLVKKHEANKIVASKLCTLWDYALPSGRLGFAAAQIDGRYPDEGKVLNRICDKTYFVISGTATVHVESGDFSIGSGDVFFFEHGKWHWVEAKDLHIVVCHTPPWSADQHERIP